MPESEPTKLFEFMVMWAARADGVDLAKAMAIMDRECSNRMGTEREPEECWVVMTHHSGHNAPPECVEIARIKEGSPVAYDVDSTVAVVRGLFSTFGQAAAARDHILNCDWESWLKRFNAQMHSKDTKAAP